MNITKPEVYSRDAIAECSMSDVDANVQAELIRKFRIRLKSPRYGGYDANQVDAIDINDSNARFYAHENGREFVMQVNVDGRVISDAQCIPRPHLRAQHMRRIEKRIEDGEKKG